MPSFFPIPRSWKRQAHVLKHIPVTAAPAINLTDAVCFNFLPGYAFEIVSVNSFCRVKAGTVTFKVKVGTREAVAAGTLTSATRVAQTLSTTAADRHGSETEAITVEYTTDGSGALTNPLLVITIRPLALEA